MGGWAAITTGRFDLDLGKVRDGEYGGRFYTSQQFDLLFVLVNYTSKILQKFIKKYYFT